MGIWGFDTPSYFHPYALSDAGFGSEPITEGDTMCGAGYVAEWLFWNNTGSL
ncbi:MAG: hypothetical protein N2748_06175 [candidate division WOR-3 bacterium]|nr:hypothetical protein [candidate division WOR-3 bacterium]